MTRQTIILRRGESRLLRATAGSRWRMTHGNLRLAEPPRWLGERIVQLDALLRSGETHAIATGGWITLHALADSAIESESSIAAGVGWATRWRIIRSARAWRVAA